MRDETGWSQALDGERAFLAFFWDDSGCLWACCGPVCLTERVCQCPVGLQE